MSNDGASSGTVIVAFAVGMVTGAALALLYAPVTGDETRRRLAETARHGRERAESLMREGRELLEREREHLTDAIERGKEAFKEARKEPL